MKQGGTSAPRKVCILAAGVGSRIGSLSESINKAILPVNHKAVISYIVEKFPDDTEFVIAVGHKKETVMDYLALAHPNRKFTFVEVDRYTGPGSGPGYSLLACRAHLDVPFIFCTSDTIVLEDIPLPDRNWMGIAPVHETEPYCTVKIKNNLVVQLDDKIKTDNRFAFIGLAGIHDHKEFFAALEQNQELRNNELQMVDGFKGLLERQLVPIGFTWFDTGTYENYVDTNTHFMGSDHKFDFSKGDEFLYFVGDRVIKFFADEDIAQKRARRAMGALQGLAPTIEGHRGNFYTYALVPGQVVYSALDTKVTRDFLAWMEKHVWKPVELDANEQNQFASACHDFYRTKTEARLKKFYEKTGLKQDPKIINGVEVPSATELLAKIDWSSIEAGIPSNFHGDLQFDNVLVSKDRAGTQTFTLIDWRQDFGGIVEHGDLYYDLAKLYGGLTISYPLIKEGMFSCEVTEERAYYQYYVKNDVLEAREAYERFLTERGYDVKKIEALSGLIFLNMSPLHNEPFDRLLHCLGRVTLHKALT